MSAGVSPGHSRVSLCVELESQQNIEWLAPRGTRDPQRVVDLHRSNSGRRDAYPMGVGKG